MRHTKAALALLIVIGVPAGAKTFIRPSAEKCFASDSAIYRFTSATDRADTTVRIAGNMSTPDVTMQVTESPELADFILIDDKENADACRRNSRAPARTINLDPAAARPDLTVRLSAEPQPAEYKIYVRSATFSIEEAAALFAVMMSSTRRHAMTDR
jgi:hypothetical protein